jgi:hypothetical protein
MTCNSIYYTEWRKRNPDKCKIYTINWRKKNLEYYREYMRRYMKKYRLNKLYNMKKKRYGKGKLRLQPKSKYFLKFTYKPIVLRFY